MSLTSQRRLRTSWPVAARCRVNVTVETLEARTGRRIARQRVHNLVVTAGRNQIRDLLHGDAVAGLTHFAVGTSGTVVAASDTALGTEVFRAAVTSKTKEPAKLTVKYFLSTTQANGQTLREAGLFNAAAGGTLYARVVLASPIVKTSSLSVTFTWELTWSV